MTELADKLNVVVVQLIRSGVQAAWAAALQLTLVMDALEWTGIDSGVVEGALFSLALVVVIVAGRLLAKVHPAFGWLLNGIHREPEYVEVEGRHV